ncbi:MAG: hypothetical protein IT436_15080, partial [Phycisphaerales bacterium]|nr:hypothetical protein [Phycisphaerales bacterium]
MGWASVSRGGRCALMAMAAGLAAGTAWASGPVNTVLIIDPGNAQSLYVGNHYKSVRGIPDANVIYLDSAASGYTSFVNGNLAGFKGMLAQRGIEDQVDIVAVAPLDSFYVSIPATEIPDDCSPVTRISIPSMYTCSFITADISPGTYISQTQQGYYSSLADSSIAFDGSLRWRSGSSSTVAAARRWFIGTSLGWTGAQGNTVDEVIAMINRSAAADGTRPAGRFFFMNNPGDPPRNVRSTQYSAVISSLTGKGAGAVTLVGALPLLEPDCLGVMTGFANFPIAASDFTMLPGSFGDHLTSYAATWDDFSQTKMSEWIRKGASGTSGAVEEPCNYTGKFPHARLHLHYYNGLTLGEAWFRSHSFVPFQTLFVGDPLTRTFTYIPTVDVPGFPAGPVSGTISFTPTGAATRPGAAMARYDLYVDGVFWSTISAAAPQLNLNTTLLDDGWHD